EVFANDGFRRAGLFLFLFDLDVAFTAVWAYRTRREDFRLLSHLSFRRRHWFIHYRHPRCCEFAGSSSEGAAERSAIREPPPPGQFILFNNMRLIIVFALRARRGSEHPHRHSLRHGCPSVSKQPELLRLPLL